MNQTRTFLLIAWAAVAFLLFQQWQAPAVTAGPASTEIAPVKSATSNSDMPALPSAAASTVLPAVAQASSAQRVEIVTDVFRLKVDLQGVSIIRAELLTFPKEKKARSENVLLLDDTSADFFVAQSGWMTQSGQAAPTHNAIFQTVDGKQQYQLMDGQNELAVPFVWVDASGVKLTKTLIFSRGSFAITQKQQIQNTGTQKWSGFAYEQLKRNAPPPPPKTAGLTNPDAFSFVGAAWYGATDKFEKVKFTDYQKDGVIQSPNKLVKDGWFGMLQHHFVTVWLPEKQDTQTYSLAMENGALPLYIVRGVSAEKVVAPGQQITREDQLWVGPKAQQAMNVVHPTLALSVDYGIFSFISKPLFWLLTQLHSLLGNWGWSIIAIVLILKAALFHLSAKQYQSMAKMRAIQPRIEALKERLGDDRQKFAMAQMELYKKEKINPASGCLPMLIPIPIFMGLYWTLVESVEIRHAPWMGWIQNLTAADPYFILPALNLIIMVLTQRLTPTPGMDPLQKKMMTFMPLVFGVMMAFFPAGLALYWVTNGLLGLAQQWYMTNKFSDSGQASGLVK